jgi:cyclase
MTRKSLCTLAVVAALTTATGAWAAQNSGKAAKNPPPAPDIEINVLPVRDNIFMLVGGGGNTTVQIGEDGILVVDTKIAPAADKLLAAIKSLSNGTIRYVINTHYHPDHVGGNAAVRAAGATIAGGNVSGDLPDASEGAQIIAHENVLSRLAAPTGEASPTPEEDWPTITYFTGKKKLFFNGEGIEILHQPSAHTDGDSIVFFRRSDVISTGDVFVTNNYPIIDVAAGGTINGELAALNRIIDMIIPVYGEEGGTLVIPGHGRLCDMRDVIDYREMVTIIRDRVQKMIEMGMSLDEVKKAGPTRDYDPRYGSTTGFWTTEKFVDAVYDTLTNEKPAESGTGGQTQ